MWTRCLCWKKWNMLRTEHSRLKTSAITFIFYVTSATSGLITYTCALQISLHSSGSNVRDVAEGNDDFPISPNYLKGHFPPWCRIYIQTYLGLVHESRTAIYQRQQKEHIKPFKAGQTILENTFYFCFSVTSGRLTCVCLRRWWHRDTCGTFICSLSTVHELFY